MLASWRLWVLVASIIVVLGGLTGLAAGGALTWDMALELSAMFTALLSLSLLVPLLQRVDRLGRRLQRESHRRKAEKAELLQRFEVDRKQVLERLRADWANLVDRLGAERDELRKEVRASWTKTADRLAADRDAVMKRFDTAAQTLGSVRKEDVPRLLQEQKRQFRAAAKHVTKQGRRDYDQVVAWYQLQEMLKPCRTMPSLRGWAASPDVLCLLVEAIRERPPTLAVECGSGASSVWLGLALRRFGGGRLIALEHDVHYAEQSRLLVADHDLGDIVEVRLAPLRPWTPDGAAPGQPWYDLGSVTDLVDIDLIFVDGPPSATGPQARYPAGPILLPRCSSRCVVVLDDAGRADEQAASDRWLEAYPDFQRSRIETEKGTDVLVRGQ